MVCPPRHKRPRYMILYLALCLFHLLCHGFSLFLHLFRGNVRICRNIVNSPTPPFSESKFKGKKTLALHLFERHRHRERTGHSRKSCLAHPWAQVPHIFPTTTIKDFRANFLEKKWDYVRQIKVLCLYEQLSTWLLF